MEAFYYFHLSVKPGTRCVRITDYTMRFIYSFMVRYTLMKQNNEQKVDVCDDNINTRKDTHISTSLKNLQPMARSYVKSQQSVWKNLK